VSKHTHIFDFCFSVTTDSDNWEKVSPEQLRLSLINRMADLPVDEYGEACGHVDTIEENENVS
jgi:hypothetical protein